MVLVAVVVVGGSLRAIVFAFVHLGTFLRMMEAPDSKECSCCSCTEENRFYNKQHIFF